MSAQAKAAYPDVDYAYDGQQIGPDIILQDGTVTLGIGMLCNDGTSVMVTVDKRTFSALKGSYEAWTCDDTQKAFPLPHGMYLVGAGASDFIHRFYKYLAERLRLLTIQQTTFETIDRVIASTRRSFISFYDEEHSPGNENNILNMAAIICGYSHSQKEPFLWYFQGRDSLKTNLSPGHCAIGTWSIASNEILWNKRKQTQKMSVTRSLFHAYEAVNYVRHLNDETKTYIGPSGDFIVLGDKSFIIPGDFGLLPEWAEEFKENSAPLDGAEYREKLMKFAMPLQAIPQDSTHDLSNPLPSRE